MRGGPSLQGIGLAALQCKLRFRVLHLGLLLGSHGKLVTCSASLVPARREARQGAFPICLNYWRPILQCGARDF